MAEEQQLAQNQSHQNNSNLLDDEGSSGGEDQQNTTIMDSDAMYPFFTSNPRPSRKGRKRLGSKFRRNGTTAAIAAAPAEIAGSTKN